MMEILESRGLTLKKWLIECKRWHTFEYLIADVYIAVGVVGNLETVN